jgi:3-deoxy-manno-octulosonate cytidylyltransferase (CMP-KDO synthetase)
MDYTVIIPARMASSRLPDKPLADLAGLPMVVRVAQRAAQSRARRVVVAADDARVLQVCQTHGIEALLTRQDHVSGSDRLAEACALLGLAGDELVVNVQGDEPLIPPGLIDDVARVLAERPEASMGTAAHAIHELAEYSNPNVVKVVMDARQMALYFSRAPIPWWRDGQRDAQRDAHFQALPSPAPLRHIGIYSYRAGFLRQFPHLPPAPIESLESLEQLRALWHGHRIAVHVTGSAPGPGVDTPADLDRVRGILANPATS